MIKTCWVGVVINTEQTGLGRIRPEVFRYLVKNPCRYFLTENLYICLMQKVLV